MADITSTNYNRDGDIAHDSKGDVPSDGQGANLLPVWESDRQTKIRSLIGGSYTNNSSFEIPNAIVDTKGYNTAFENGELFHGIWSTGTALDEQSKPLSGTVEITAGAGASYSQAVNGSYSVSFPPPVGVPLGQNVPGSTYDFVFTPSINGVALVKEDIPPYYKAGVFQYGKVEGTITDYDGNTVEGATVGGIGAASSSGKNGYYQLIAPGGTTTTLYALGKTYSFNVDIGKGETVRRNIKYPKLVVEVLGPDYEPMENAPVSINGSTRYTDSNGEVVIQRAKLQKYDVVAQSEYTLEGYEIVDAGTLHELQIGPGIALGSGSGKSRKPEGALVINVVDEVTDAPVTEVDALVAGEARSLSDTSGRVTLLSSNQGETVGVVIAANDKRYETASFTAEIPQNDSYEATVQLGREKGTPTY